MNRGGITDESGSLSAEPRAVQVCLPTARLASYSYAKTMLEKHGLNARKSLGQNFLIDEHVLNKIIAASGLTKNHAVIEIGPGLGALTQRLCEAAGRVTAIELDRSLIPLLKETLGEYDNLEIINADILSFDLRSITRSEPRPVSLVSNLPYYITTPIIMGILEDNPGIESITVMVQKEVGNRMRAKPGSKDYGALSLSVEYYASVSHIANVPSNCFLPRPNVDSCVIRLDTANPPRVETSDKDFMFAVIKASFAMRRKTLVNCLSSAGIADKRRAADTLQSLGFPESIRGEALSLDDFARLSEALRGL